jgi:transcription antitermination protein NusB
VGARRTARERALQALFYLEQDQSKTAIEAVTAAFNASDDEGSEDPASRSFAVELVDGVKVHLSSLDSLLDSVSHNWRLDRMQRIDRNILRLGAFELSQRADIPKKVTLNEAVELGKKFGNEESAAFINGLLDKLAASLGKE